MIKDLKKILTGLSATVLIVLHWRKGINPYVFFGRDENAIEAFTIEIMG